MRILVDENIPRMTVERLREMGHDVEDIRGTPSAGIPDAELWDVAQAEVRLLITTDKGFTEHRGERHAGVLIVRLRQPNRVKIHQSVMSALERFRRGRMVGVGCRHEGHYHEHLPRACGVEKLTTIPKNGAGVVPRRSCFWVLEAITAQLSV